MSADLQITFAAGLPTMAVDVVESDLSIVKTLMIFPESTVTVTGASTTSFLRVHLPSGRAVTLHDPGNSKRMVTPDSLGDPPKPEESEFPVGTFSRAANAVEESPGRDSIRRQQLGRFSWADDPAPRVLSLNRGPNVQEATFEQASLGPFGDAWVVDDKGRRAEFGFMIEREVEWRLGGPPDRPPFTLHVLRPDGRELVVRLPGNSEHLRLRVDELRAEGTLHYTVRVQSSEPNADTICNYVCRGDFDSAHAMTSWAANSEHLLGAKYSDPYAAAVGGYLLLRFRHFERLHDWARNLANDFPFSDGCVLWASQLLEQEPARVDEIKEYLLRAPGRGVPIYTAGLRLLIDGLRILGLGDDKALSALRSKIGQVIWESPLTAYVRSVDKLPIKDIERLTFDIEFSAQV